MRQIIKFLIRAAVIYYLLQSFSFIINEVYQFIIIFDVPDIPWISVIPYIVFKILTIGFLCLLWWKADKLVSIMAGEINESTFQINISNKEFIRILILVFGIYLVLTTIPIILGLVGYTYYLESRNFGPLITEHEIMNYVRYGASLFIGIGLIIWATGYRKIFGYIRDFIGFDNNTDNNDKTSA